VIGGLVTLVLVIPFAARFPDEPPQEQSFFSARAAYWCVIAGLAILMVMSTGLAVRTALGGKIVPFLAKKEIRDRITKEP